MFLFLTINPDCLPDLLSMKFAISHTIYFNTSGSKKTFIFC